MENKEQNKNSSEFRSSMTSFWKTARWLLLGFLGIIVSAGCADYAVTAHEHFYWIPAILNICVYGWQIYRGVKK